MPVKNATRRWKAEWIWHPEESGVRNSYYYLRKDFTVEDGGAARGKGSQRGTTKLYVCADTVYRLYLDGEAIGQGPLRSQSWNMYYDRYELDLKPGAHCFGAEVYYQGAEGGSEAANARGGFLLEGEDSTGLTIIATDASWRILPAASWRRDGQFFRMNKVNAFQEWFDARAVPSNRDGTAWNRAGYDDSQWRRAACVPGRNNLTMLGGPAKPPQAGPWTFLQERDIPPMATRALLPRAITEVEECQGLANRIRGNDVSIRLSMPGMPIRFARADGPERLLAGTAAAGAVGAADAAKGAAPEAAVFRCSTAHLEDRSFDGLFEPCVTLDFGAQITAYLELELDGPAGATIEFGFAERLIDGRFNNSLEGFFGGAYTLRGPEGTNTGDSVSGANSGGDADRAADGIGGAAAGDKTETFRSFNWIGFRYLRLRVSNAFQDVRIRAVRAVETTYPFVERGRFVSSDARLNSIFSMCRNTLRLCSNEFIMDTPWREQGQWLGDVSAVTLGGLYACFGDRTLTEKFLRQCAANLLPSGIITNMTNSASFDWVNPIPDYSLWWVWALWNHYEYTGDAEWIHEFYPQALRIFQFFRQYVDETGLAYRVAGWNFTDWAPIDRRGYSASLNAILHMALGALGKMAELRKDTYYAAEVAALRSGIACAFEARFYDEEKGLCVDSTEYGEDSATLIQSNIVSEHTNALAILNGLVRPEAAARILRAAFVEPTLPLVEAQPYFCTFVLLALEKAGRMDLAMKMLVDRWGGRMADTGTTSCHEEWGINGSWRHGQYSGFMRTLSHAWSAYPADFLIRRLAGLEILEPGCSRIRLDPVRIGADYELAIPLPAGEAAVRVRGGKIDIQVPPGVRVER